MAGKRVLIVEDEPVIGFALEDMLESLGWETIGVASRVQEALDLMTLGELVTLAGERLQALGKTLRRQEQDHERTERIWENLG